MDNQEYHTLRAVEDTHWWFRSLHEFICATLRRTLQTTQPRLLDAGCGTGGLLQQLEKLGEAEGVDASPIAVEYCQERGLAVRQADINTVQLPAEHYDGIVSVDMLYHRSVRDPAAALRLFYAALKPGGVLFLHLPAYEMLRSRHDDRVHTGRRFRLRQVCSMLGEAGFTVEESSYRVTLLFLPALAARLLSRSEESDLSTPSPFLNRFLLAVSRLEHRIIRRLPFPFGISLYAVARKSYTSP